MLKSTLIVITLVLFVFSAPAHSQEFKNEIKVGLGAFTFPDVTESTKEVGGLMVTLGFVKAESKRATPAFLFNYGRFVKDELKLSLSFDYQKFDVDVYWLDNLVGVSEISYYSFMLRGDYIWYRKDWVNLYSGAGIGFASVVEDYGDESDTEYWFAFHVNAIGIRMGNRIAGFVECGFGYDGIFSAGLMAAF